MKIAYTSDIHIDITENNKKIMPYLIDYLKEIKPDVFIIAGDLANTNDELSKALKLFTEITAKKIFVPGNHDLWIESKNKLKKGFDSSYKYEKG